MSEMVSYIARIGDRRRMNKGRWWDRRKNPDRRKARPSRSYEYIGMSLGVLTEVE